MLEPLGAARAIGGIAHAVVDGGEAAVAGGAAHAAAGDLAGQASAGAALLGRTSNGMPNDPLWFQKSVFMEIDVRAFQDSTGSGHGDFAGLANRLDHVQGLGVDAIWVKPMYPSGGKDGGYDITNYMGIDERFGSMDDFQAFTDAAHARGMRVVTELVANHTSDQHVWFRDEVAQLARMTPAERRSFASSNQSRYVWDFSHSKADGPPKRFEDTRVIFQDFEPSNWTWNEQAQGWNWHRFFKEQPDLNFDNPVVREDMAQVLESWADRGVDGFRLDAVPYLFEREGTWAHSGEPFQGENLAETHQYLKDLRTRMDEKYSNRIFVGEANMPRPETLEYFGGDGKGGGVGDEVHVGFGFVQMPANWLSQWKGDKRYAAEAMMATRDIPEGTAWGSFDRNHDELTLEKVDPADREWAWNLFRNGSPERGITPDPEAPINLGLRLRQADAVGHDDDPALKQAAVRMRNSLLMSQPGTPFIYQGDEIMLPKTRGLFDRDGVRTTMQWDDTVNAGFSVAHPDKVAEMGVPTNPDVRRGASHVSVAAQEHDAGSPLNQLRELIAARRAIPEFQSGYPDVIDTGHDGVLAFTREHEGSNAVSITNLTPHAVDSSVDLAARFPDHHLEPLYASHPVKVGDAMPGSVQLEPYGFQWYRVVPNAG
jgi:maltose alpha-D-glucosyltransferase/alpha-amylase